MDTIKKRLVLDTNVCLDLFVFKDPRWHNLMQALISQDIEAITREDCRNEWLRVLDYPHLPVTPEIKAEVIKAFDQYITCLPKTDQSTFGLPLCTDKDDQKFLEIALHADAHILLTKDKALLKLAKKTRNKGMFQILAPQAWNPEMI